MTVQLIIVYVVGVLIVAYLIYKVHRIFLNREYRHICRNCPMGKDCNKSKPLRNGCHKNGRPE